MKKLMIGLSAGALALAGTAFAAHHEGHAKADADGDGVITRAEMQAHSAAMFARMDANSDGKLDQTDRDARRAERRTKMFDKLDADGNGSISRDEFMAFEREGKRGHRMGKHDGEGHGKHHRWGKRGGHHGMKMMKMADTDNDGAISQAEFTAAAEQRFAAADTNGDGQLTKEERDAYREQMRAKWRENRDG
jgi:hypothetical protein